jgi:flavin-dependent dehydrogenase
MSDKHSGAESLSCDVLVIGGGPGGSAVATLLARRGRKVVLLEKSRHPRAHIGESLLPWSMPLLAELGILDQMEGGIGIVKRGVDFFADRERKSHQTYLFQRKWAEDAAHAFEVERSAFDELLFHNATKAGAFAEEGVRVRAVEFRGDAPTRVEARDEAGRERVFDARFVVDASGRDTFLANRFGLKRKNRKNASSALYGYFRDVPRLAGNYSGNLSLYWFEHGWIWLIPLPNGSMSVGVVCWPEYLKTRDCSPEEFFLRTLALPPLLAERMRGAELEGKVRATGNYSYFSRTASGEGWLLIGDAFAFLDPVFSSGVHIALTSAFLAAETVDGILENPARARRLTRAYERELRRGMNRFSWFIYRFNAPAFRGLFMDPSARFGMFDAVRGLLGGDVFRRAPTEAPIRLFQAIYYIASALTPRVSLAAWRRRRRNLAA